MERVIKRVWRSLLQISAPEISSKAAGLRERSRTKKQQLHGRRPDKGCSVGRGSNSWARKKTPELISPDFPQPLLPPCGHEVADRKSSSQQEDVEGGVRRMQKTILEPRHRRPHAVAFQTCEVEE